MQVLQTFVPFCAKMDEFGFACSTVGNVKHILILLNGRLMVS